MKNYLNIYILLVLNSLKNIDNYLKIIMDCFKLQWNN